MTTAPTDTPVVVGPFSLEEFFAWDGRIDGDDGRSDPPMWELVDGMAILMGGKPIDDFFKKRGEQVYEPGSAK